MTATRRSNTRDRRTDHLAFDCGGILPDQVSRAAADTGGKHPHVAGRRQSI